MQVGQMQQNLSFGDCSAILNVTKQEKRKLFDQYATALRGFPNSVVQISYLKREEGSKIAIYTKGANEIAEKVLQQITQNAYKNFGRIGIVTSSAKEDYAKKFFSNAVSHCKGTKPEEVSPLPAYYA
jgi:hypothetical protein